MPVHTRARIAEQQSHADRILAAERRKQKLYAAAKAKAQGSKGRNAAAVKNSAKPGATRSK